MEHSIQGILFDFDDTLQDRDQAYRKYASFFLEKYFPTLPKAEKQPRIDEMAVRINGGYRDRFEYFGELIDLWHWPDPPALASLEAEYNNVFPHYTTLFDDTLPVLKVLRERGYRLGIVSNGLSSLQNKKMDVAGMRPYMDTVIVSGDYICHKPDPRIFAYAAQTLSLPCATLAFVGDHPVNDMQGARDAGMVPVRMNYGVFKDQAMVEALVIDKLASLLTIFP